MSFVGVSFDNQIALQSIRVSVVGFILAFYVVYRSGAIDVMVKLFVHFVVKIFNINVQLDLLSWEHGAVYWALPVTLDIVLLRCCFIR